jgi:hypothetical protein
MTDYEKFIQARGWEFTTEEALKEAYDRNWKCKQDILLTKEEFVAEANRPNVQAAEEVYEVLVNMVNSNKLRAAEVYAYAKYRWCLGDAEAIIAYQTEPDRWEVNNCGTKVPEDKAKIAVNSEWGFEASRIQIIGTPYYDATDYQFIRFDCAHMTWLWKNGNLYQVYA